MKASYMERVSIFSERRISRMSRKPSVVIRAVRAMFPVTRALVAAVVPWTMRSISPMKASRLSEKAAAASPRAPRTPAEKSSGVEGDLNSRSPPASSMTTQSVKVPPVSMQTRNNFATRLLIRLRWAFPRSARKAA